MLTPFWNCKSPILEYYVARETINNSKTYCDVLENLETCNQVKKKNIVVCSVLVFYYGMIMRDLKQHLQQLNKSQI